MEHLQARSRSPLYDDLACDSSVRSQRTGQHRAPSHVNVKSTAQSIAVNDPCTPPRSPDAITLATKVQTRIGLATPPETPETSPKETIRRQNSLAMPNFDAATKIAIDDSDSKLHRTIIPEGANYKMGSMVGAGQWSTVYRARIRSRRLILESIAEEAQKDVLAVKKAVRGPVARRVILNEAKYLTYLSRIVNSDAYIVPFYGWDDGNEMTIMGLVELTLENYAKTVKDCKLGDACWARIQQNFRTITKGLIQGLGFIHKNNVIHGDIKPANVLLKQTNPSAVNLTEDDLGSHNTELKHLQPLYCDFTAARFNDPQSIPSESAQTYDYMAPELFTLQVPECYPTQSSDVYALGMTLLFMALGDTPFKSAPNPMMRRAMAQEGNPFYFMCGSMEERLYDTELDYLIRCAVEKKAEKRFTAAQLEPFALELRE